MKRTGWIRRKKPMAAWKPDADAVKDMKGQHLRLLKRAGGDVRGAPCERCKVWHPSWKLAKAHKDGLGTRATRYNRAHPLNDDANLELLCPKCHVIQEAETRARKFAEREELSDALRWALKPGMRPPRHRRR